MHEFNLSKCFSKNTLDKTVGEEGKVAGGTGDPATGTGQLSISGAHYVVFMEKRLATLHVSFCFAFIKKKHMLCPVYRVPCRAAFTAGVLSCFTTVVAVFFEGIKCFLTSKVL